MTPAEHLAEAERLLDQARGNEGDYLSTVTDDHVLAALAHAVIAVAGELGVPHPAAPAGGGPSGVS